MKTPDGNTDGYILARTKQESARLDEQHHNTVLALGFLVHPSIPTTSKSLRIADLSCGSGAWLRDAARAFPQSQCDGFDISSAGFPDDESLEADLRGRVRFHVQDTAASDGFPDEFLGKFDVVAVRYVHVTMKGEQWEFAARNVASLLNPGGWVQWVDWDPMETRILQTKALAPCEGIKASVDAFKAMGRNSLDTAQALRIPERLANAGLQDVRSELFPTDLQEETRSFFTGTMLGSWPTVIKGALERGVEIEGFEDERRVDEIAEQIKREIGKGAFLRMEIFCFTAQKSL
ncbi:hypothetical protein K431DRAFT_282530 [Polychaeton citri CBS 116435]|uniref:Methyltransferase type 12 domain-containing protein n=1 Tax=Polychaeton citri CBS 116435 TaxID=1314669 RepID=A0A9P4QFA9_9PEZI|nr:hypothetical protein K431DRAFT_282530 [Polychaeton citri CBS 116435]